jgi:hypothetical protein
MCPAGEPSRVGLHGLRPAGGPRQTLSGELSSKRPADLRAPQLPTDQWVVPTRLVRRKRGADARFHARSLAMSNRRKRSVLATCATWACAGSWSMRGRNTAETDSEIVPKLDAVTNASRSTQRRGNRMWWTLLLLGMALVGPLRETLEKHWLNRRARALLSGMRSHKVAGHRWDITRGQWQS